MTIYTFQEYIEHKYFICLRKFILPSCLFQCNITFCPFPSFPCTFLLTGLRKHSFLLSVWLVWHALFEFF